ncbi:MAG: tRNA preQ1(34) S-adenosylmethionine ribosyltransferase-isomerase QueA [Hyphomicrobiales bacterium]|nr:tRNA preQ1(34) S-adenosylmethionine ribosyltransferase-isomerase QueA [Hyphomicrobiales bacterium]
MDVSAFDFELPEARIALRPARPRDSARLLHVTQDDAASLGDHSVRDLPALLRPGDALVFNDTKVIHARLDGIRTRPSGQGVHVEVNLHKQESPETWRAFVRPAKRFKAGDTVRFKPAAGDRSLTAKVTAKGEGGEVTLCFEAEGETIDAALAQIGVMPLPPYIASKRAIDAEDEADYQTVFAEKEGSVAAPTAGLHFTEPLLQAIKEAGVSIHFLTLHVGAGTFLPVKVEDTKDHKMHAERGIVTMETANALNAVRAGGGRIVAGGTTAMRLLETSADDDGRFQPFDGETDIFITPGYRFKGVDVLFTNFHLPRSTLFMLVSAFSGLETMKRAYAHAIAADYRFYSYGDASLLERADG